MKDITYTMIKFDKIVLITLSVIITNVLCFREGPGLPGHVAGPPGSIEAPCYKVCNKECEVQTINCKCVIDHNCIKEKLGKTFPPLLPPRTFPPLPPSAPTRPPLPPVPKNPTRSLSPLSPPRPLPPLPSLSPTRPPLPTVPQNPTRSHQPRLSPIPPTPPAYSASPSPNNDEDVTITTRFGPEFNTNVTTLTPGNFTEPSSNSSKTLHNIFVVYLASTFLLGLVIVVVYSWVCMGCVTR